MKVLIIEDDVQLNIAISEFFKIKAFDSVSVKDGLSAIDQIDNGYFDLYIVDINIQSVLGNIGEDPYENGPHVDLSANTIYDLNDDEHDNDGLGHSSGGH